MRAISQQRAAEGRVKLGPNVGGFGLALGRTLMFTEATFCPSMESSQLTHAHSTEIQLYNLHTLIQAHVHAGPWHALCTQYTQAYTPADTSHCTH